jgi:hypothetical protein
MMHNVRGVNKKKGQKRRWGKRWWSVSRNDGRTRRYGWLYVGSRKQGTLKKRLMRYWAEDNEWWPEGKWIKVEE